MTSAGPGTSRRGAHRGRRGRHRRRRVAGWLRAITAWLPRRLDPTRIAARVADRVAAGDARGALETVRTALRLPYAALRGPKGALLASAGDPPHKLPLTLHTVTLRRAEAHVGALVVSPRAGQRHIRSRHRAVLRMTAAAMSVTLRIG